MAALSDRPVDSAERLRLGAAGSRGAAHRARLGQFFTPAPVARMVASMLAPQAAGRVRLLDPGAGVGALTAAAVERFATLGVRELEVVAWEIDAGLHPQLRDTLGRCAAWGAERGVSVLWELREGDYVQAAAEACVGDSGGAGEFDAVVMNPPYRKVNGDAAERRALERIGLPITNLYTAFLALAAGQLAPGGALAAITPRSFANGRYSAPFRRFFFDLVGIERLHLFESRTDAFADSGVLQENVIFSVRRDTKPEAVQVSFSRGVADEPRVLEVPGEEIVRSDDPDLFLRIPSDEDDTDIAAAMTALPSSLEDLGIAVSTGRVVEFRAREHLRVTPEAGTAPLLRPNHFKDGGIRWPAADRRGKPNALAAVPASAKLLLPNGTYVLVKRLTAKEERRRVRAAVCDPTVAPGPRIAFENHLNVFHRDNEGLPPDLAQGLAAFLNSTLVERYVRQFNGHTQINATDLRHLRYPAADDLALLGRVVSREAPGAQEELDRLVDRAVRGVAIEAEGQDALEPAA